MREERGKERGAGLGRRRELGWSFWAARVGLRREERKERKGRKRKRGEIGLGQKGKGKGNRFYIFF